MLGLVALHGLFESVGQLLVVLTLGHVDEVDGDDAPHVTKAQHPRDFWNHVQVGQQRILLLARRALLPAAAVHIDDVHGFRLLDHEIRPRPQVHLTTKRRLDLAVDGHVVEQVFGPAQFDHGLVPGFALGQELLDLICHARVVHVNGGARLGHDVAEDGADLVHFAQHALPWLGTLEVGVQLLPTVDQILQVCVQVCRALVFRHRPHNDPKPWGLDALHEATQPAAFFFPFDARRQAHLVAERNQHQIAPRQTDFRRQPRTLGADGLLRNLNQNELRRGHVVLHLALPVDVFFPLEFADVGRRLLA